MHASNINRVDNSNTRWLMLASPIRISR